MNPIKTAESNYTLLGPTPEVGDLHCKAEGGNIFSIWEFTAEERKAIAEGANIRLGVYRSTPPPMSLEVVSAEGCYEKKTDRCSVCGEMTDHPLHCGIKYGHAFRARGALMQPTKYA